jgi:hypothetical protein
LAQLGYAALKSCILKGVFLNSSSIMFAKIAKILIYNIAQRYFLLKNLLCYVAMNMTFES